MIVAVMALVICTAVMAENYPYRSDYLWVTTPNHADWLYETGEKATVEVQFFKYGIPQEGTVFLLPIHCTEAGQPSTLSISLKYCMAEYQFQKSE